ncbi:type II toxin-antitoxin system RelE/ParE family toxin [Candidatus Woesebacteria bacterium]|nr:type II toxin-antitoxin system RelE/ParE family toxin [Candidatus Woesebacteria bacterium]
MPQKEKWKIVYYESTNGSFPIYEFINGLEARAKSKVINTLDYLEIYGTRLGLPHVKKVTRTDLWELRILGSDNIRIFYVATFGRTFLLLHGFVKKSPKTPNKEIKIAVARLKEYKSRSS